MKYAHISYEGFTAILKRALWLDDKYLVYCEVAGFEASVKAITAALLARRVVNCSLKGGFELYCHEEFRRLLYSNKLLAHAIIYPAEKTILIGFSKEELREKLLWYIKNSPVPFDDSFAEEIMEAVENGELDGYRMLSGFNAFGMIIFPYFFWRALELKISRIIRSTGFLKGPPAKIRSLDDLLDRFGDSLAEELKKRYKPLYEVGKKYPELAGVEERLEEIYRFSGKKKIQAQKEIILAAHKAFMSGRNRVVICGEQGTGKTFMALATAGTFSSPQRVLVVCPPHMVGKWAREAKETLPGVRVYSLNGKNVLSTLQLLTSAPKRPPVNEVWIIGRERLKLSCGWEPALMLRKCFPLNSFKGELPVCPDCGLWQCVWQCGEAEVLVKLSDFEKKKRKCQWCGAPLWQATGKPRRWSPAEFIKRKLKGKFQLLIVDECHEYKAQSTAQATAVGSILGACDRALFLTGTLMGGYADDLFYLYFRAFPEQFRAAGFGWNSGQLFMKRYGVLEEVVIFKRGYDDNLVSRGRKERTYKKRRPGVSPEVLGKFLLPNTLFIRVSDLADNLPGYEEKLVVVPREEDEDGGEYERCLDAYRESVREIQNSASRLVIASKFVPVLLNLPDCVRHLENTITSGSMIIHKTSIVEGPPLSKERWLVELAKAEKEAGRKVLVYCTFTRTKDITYRLKEVLTAAGLAAEVLPASVDTSRREEWIRRNAGELDVMICNPRLVETGLDLFDFPTVVFYQPGYRIYTLRQAARRSWRVGQQKNVKVYFLCSKGTIQEDAWSLIAEKWRVSLTVEGELITENLAFQSESDSVLVELAKRLVSGKLGSSAEEAFEKFKKQEREDTLPLPPEVLVAVAGKGKKRVVMKVKRDRIKEMGQVQLLLSTFFKAV